MPEQAQTKTTEFVDQLNNLISDFKVLDDESAARMNQEFRAAIAKITKGMSPIGLINAYIDWLGHLSLSPGKQLQLIQSLGGKLYNLGTYTAESIKGNGIELDPPSSIKDRTFSTEGWNSFPFNFFSQSYLLAQQWFKEATGNVDGLTKDHEEMVNFINEQILGLLSPANFPITNPEIIQKTKSEQGANLKRGLENLIQDVKQENGSNDAPGSDQFVVGKNIGISPGKVVYQNQLIELIQYSPSTELVGKEPILFVPPWIMKYYILDLSPKNSMVKYLVDQGKTVFMISWKNPTEKERDLGMNAYLDMGLMESLKAIQAIVPGAKVNTVGYCIGGTLLLIGAAALAGQNNGIINSITLLAAQADFSEPGDIKRFLSDSHLAFLESLMWKQGYLDADNMGDAFKALRPGDLIWGPMIQRYFHGEESFMNDLMAWNADGTRMPYQMHHEYLRKMYLDNELALGHYEVNGRKVSLSDIEAPMFVVGTQTDHVAPWKSVYKLHQLTNDELTFLLTSGGHNAGIISGPSHPRRSYQVHTRKPRDKYICAETWQDSMDSNQGSWWPVWNQWLDQQMSEQRKPPRTGNAAKGYKAIKDAPGEYVLEP